MLQCTAGPQNHHHHHRTFKKESSLWTIPASQHFAKPAGMASINHLSAPSKPAPGQVCPAQN